MEADLACLGHEAEDGVGDWLRLVFYRAINYKHGLIYRVYN